MKPISLLLVGPPGSGKSYLAKTAPKPLWVANFDQDASATYDGLPENEIVKIDYPADYESCNTFYKNTTELHRRFREKDTNLPATAVFDSGTGFVRRLIQAQITLNANTADGNPKKRMSLFNKAVVPTLDDWNVVLSYFQATMQEFLDLPCHKIVICHDAAVTNEKGAIVQIIPSLPGKNRFARSFASNFTGAGYCEQNTPMRSWQVRFAFRDLVGWTFFRNLSDPNLDTVENTWQALEKVFEKAGLV